MGPWRERKDGRQEPYRPPGHRWQGIRQGTRRVGKDERQLLAELQVYESCRQESGSEDDVLRAPRRDGGLWWNLQGLKTTRRKDPRVATFAFSPSGEVDENSAQSSRRTRDSDGLSIGPRGNVVQHAHAAARSLDGSGRQSFR